MTFQPGANINTLGFGNRPENVEVPHLDVRDPTTTDIMYPVGKKWTNTVLNNVWELTSFSTSSNVTSAHWQASAGDTLVVSTLSGDTGTATPTAGNIKIAGTTNQVVTSASGSTVTIALTGPYTPATYTAHGVLIGEGTSSIVATTPGTTGQVLIGATGADPAFGSLGVNSGLTAHGVLLGEGNSAIVATAVGATGQALMGSTGADPGWTGSPSFSGSVTAATTITATLGNITATNGNVVLGTAGNKLNSTSVASTTTAGANSFGTVALASGTATVATTAVTASSMIHVTCQALGTVTAPQAMAVTTKTANTSFVITSADATDTSTVAWFIIN